MEKELNEWEMVARQASTLKDVEDILRIKEEFYWQSRWEMGKKIKASRGACNSAVFLDPIVWKGRLQPTGPYPSTGGSN